MRGDMALGPNRFHAEHELYRSHRTIVELGARGAEWVVIKRSVGHSPSGARRRAAHEARLLQLVRSDYVIACYGGDRGPSEAHDAEHVLLEYLEGVTLAQLPLPLPVERFWGIALDACRALAAVHDAQIIHKDVNPSNFVLTKSGVTKLIDFDIATRVTRENRRFRAPSQIDGTLLFIAPEQTGRTSRPLDLRADLYSLGATFYWLLAGRPPFEETDPVALLHRHIAERPKPLPDPDVPAVLDRIVQKLLAKNAEDRYQSARGLERDLLRARAGTLGELGLDDVPYRLVLPARILGREREAEALWSAFDAMRAGERCRVALVAGYSGIGKTALVREVHKPLVACAGYFLHGKFNPFDRNTPYAALSVALESHVRVLLGEGPEAIEAWKRKLKAALGDRAGALVGGFPVLEPLLGPPDTANGAAHGRSAASEADPQVVSRLLQRLFGALASREHPLVLFLDDLQWADAATLAFIERTTREGRSILIVGAYRDNEVGPAHPLRELLARIGGAIACELTLQPLSERDVARFVAETLCRPADEVAQLAATLHQRTGGNPFFLGQTLLELEHEEVLALRRGVWEWEPQRIAALAPAEHVADITAQRIAKAPGDIRELLFVTACIGHEIDVAQLDPLLGLAAPELEARIERALYDGFLTLLEPGRLAFLHDRVRLAAYEQRDEAARRAQHKRVAEVLLGSGQARGRRLFDAVSQLKAAFDLERPNEDPEISSALVELSLLAAERAHASGAFEAAAGFARSCRAVLTARGEGEGAQYRAATMLYGDAQYSLGNLEAAHGAYDELLAIEADPVRRSAVYRKKAVAKTVEGELAEAYGYFVALVRELGFDFNTLPTADEAAGMVQWARDTLGEFGLAELEQLPRNDESLSAVLIDACLYFGTIAYAFRPESFQAVQSYTLIHCFDWGIPPSAPPMITAWAYCAASVRDYPLALEVAHAGCRLAEKHSPPAVAERARTLYAMLAMHYEKSCDEQLLELRAAADRSAAHGDLEYAGYARAEHDLILVLSQGATARVAERLAASRAWAGELHVLPSARLAQRLEAHLAALRGAEGEIGALPQRPAGPQGRGDSEPLNRARDHALRAALCALTGEHEAGCEHYARFVEVRAQVEGTFVLTLVSFYGAVCLLMARARAKEAPLDQARARLLSDALELVAAHAAQNPRASGAHALLLEALASNATSPDPFERAIERAQASGAPIVAALAAALAAERCRANGDARVARSFAEQAARDYGELGLLVAVRSLQARLQGIALSHGSPLALEVAGTATGLDPRSLDLWSAVRASHALSAELQAGPLISRLLNLAREAAGAQRAVLIAHDNGPERALSVVAELRGDRELSVREPLASTPRVPVPLIERAMRAGDARVVHDAARDAEWADLPYFKASDVRSALCVPIGQGAGALYLENSLASGAFDAGRVEVLRVLASQASISLQNARLLEEEAEKDRLRSEMETAARIQQALVPSAPRIAGCEIAVHMTPADKVGGDYYDVLRAGDRDWFVIGDVCGHGLPAGLIMVICQTALHAVLQGQPHIDPAQALSQINRVLKANLERFQDNKYVAITLFRHLGDGVIEYAGLHEDLLIYRRETDSVEVRATAGTWLGILPEIAPLIPVRRIQLAPQDTLLLYTDGVIDARAADGALWGRTGLERLLRDCGRLPLETIKERVLAELAGYRKTDDVTLFLLRRQI